MLCVVVGLVSNALASGTGSYDIVVEDNGNALVILALEGNETVELPLPLDVSYPEVQNGIYVQTQNGIEVSLTEGSETVVAYETSLLTSKAAETWTFEMTLPELDGFDVTVSLPKKASIKEVSPAASVRDSIESRDLVWDASAKDGRISVSYSFPSEDVSIVTTTTLTEATTTTMSLSSTTTTMSPSTTQPASTTSSTIPKQADFGISLILIVILCAIALVFLITVVFVMARGGKKPGMTEGMLKVMRTLGGNEYKIVDTLLKNGGGMRRNELERGSGISKSSLALALSNLERKGIVEVNKDNTTHYVELTMWFKAL